MLEPPSVAQLKQCSCTRGLADAVQIKVAKRNLETPEKFDFFNFVYGAWLLRLGTEISRVCDGIRGRDAKDGTRSISRGDEWIPCREEVQYTAFWCLKDCGMLKSVSQRVMN